MAEDVIEHLGGGDDSLTGYLAKVVETEAKVFAEQIAAQSEMKTVDDSLEIGLGMAECIIMSGRSDDRLHGMQVGKMGTVVYELAQFVQACPYLGTDRYDRYTATMGGGEGSGEGGGTARKV